MDDLERQLRALADHRASLLPGTTEAVPGTDEAVPGTDERVPRRWLVAAAVLAVGLVAGAVALVNRDEGSTPLTTASPTTAVSDTTFVSERWGFSFDAPNTWAPDSDGWSGPDGGRLTVAAHDAVGTVDEIAAKIAQLADDAPVEPTTVDGQAARLVRPDTLVVALPAPRLGMSTLVLTIDPDHLDLIVPTVRWIEPAATRTWRSDLGFTVEVPVGWADVELDAEPVLVRGAEGPDGHVLVMPVDQPDRVPFFESVPPELPDLAAFVRELVANFPDEYGTAPTLDPVSIGGREGWRITPSPDGARSTDVSYVADPTTAGSRFVEITVDAAHASDVIASLVWDDPQQPDPCPAVNPPADVTRIGAADVDGDGTADPLEAWSDGSGIQVHARTAGGPTGAAHLGITVIPDLLAAVDLNGGGDEVFVTGPGNTARNAVILTFDGCRLDVVPDDSGTGEPFLALIGIGGNSCAPTGCRPIVACYREPGWGPVLLTAVVGPDGAGALSWRAETHRMADGAMQWISQTTISIDPDSLPEGWNAYEDAIGCPAPLPTEADEALVDGLIAWAVDPGGPPPLPLADRVVLALGSAAHRTVDAAELADPAAWIVDAVFFNAYTGPFDLLAPLRDAGAGAGAGAERELTAGYHRHCASPPIPDPPPLFGQRRLGLQVVTGDSCLQWAAVDLWVDDSGTVVGIGLDLYEP